MHKTITLKVPDSIKQYRNNKNTVSIDESIVDTIKFLWDNGIETLGSCCGEGMPEIDNRPNLILPEKYSNSDIDKIRELIREAEDYREWILAQWRCVEVGIGEKPVRPFYISKNQL